LQVDQHDDRWPRYTAAAAALGLRAQLAVRLYGHTRTAGSMTFLSTAAPEFGPDTQAVAQVYAGHVGAVLGRARSDDHWTSAIDSRQVIGQATGIVMERRGVGADTAFAQLVRISTDTNVKLREVARRLVAGELTLPPPA
ncbi:MAG: hypothetical protein JWR20_2846, partial [Marmoricola sp.]|nr:hypothetical protein [Marmoricola sp.]